MVQRTPRKLGACSPSLISSVGLLPQTRGWEKARGKQERSTGGEQAGYLDRRAADRLRMKGNERYFRRGNEMPKTLFRRVFIVICFLLFLSLPASLVTAQESTITVTSPNGGEQWEVGSAQNIAWTSTESENVKIDYSTNNGGNWSEIVASTANDGSHPWTVPNTPSDQCLVRVGFDTSNEVFTITGPEMDVKGNDISIVDGDSTPLSADHTDFGSADIE